MRLIIGTLVVLGVVAVGIIFALATFLFNSPANWWVMLAGGLLIALGIARWDRDLTRRINHTWDGD